MNTKTTHSIALIIFLTLLLAACAPGAAAPTSTLVPTLAVAGTPETPAQPAAQEPTAAAPTQVVNAEGSYPAPGDAAEAYPAQSATAESGYPGPASAPVMENRRRITARLVEQAPDETTPGWVRLRAEVLTSAAVEQMPSFTDNQVGQQIDLYVEGEAPSLAAGDTFSALVSYRGDEFGGRFIAQEVQKEG